jgi:hypothetical protein
MIGVENGSCPDNNSKFAKEFEQYRQACREKYEQYKPPVIVEEELSEEEEIEEEVKEENTKCENIASPSVLRDIRPSSAPKHADCNNTSSLSYSAGDVKLNSSVEMLKSGATAKRRNSLTKMISSFSNVFKKSAGSDSPTLSSSAGAKDKEKEKAKMERKKAEQDFRMARFIAELEMEGRSDQEIQLHLFHLRDQAQFARPRSNSFGEFFRGMHQAFKDEFAVRNERECVTLHVSTANPFSAAVPTNYVHDMGYSYEDLVSLEPVPRGLQSCDHLPTTVFEGQELPSNQTTCAVCMADFEISEDLRSLHCTHHFHKECIDKWLGVAKTCPVCKGEVCSE